MQRRSEKPTSLKNGRPSDAPLWVTSLVVSDCRRPGLDEMPTDTRPVVQAVAGRNFTAIHQYQCMRTPPIGELAQDDTRVICGKFTRTANTADPLSCERS